MVARGTFVADKSQFSVAHLFVGSRTSSSYKQHSYLGRPYSDDFIDGCMAIYTNVVKVGC